MRVIMDEIEVGMRIRKLNKDEDDNRFIKIGEGYKGAFIQVDDLLWWRGRRFTLWDRN